MNIRAFIDQWPIRADLAAEVGVSVDTVHKWTQRGTIPPEYHLKVIEAAMRRGFTTDPLVLAKLHVRATLPVDNTSTRPKLATIV